MGAVVGGIVRKDMVVIYCDSSKGFNFLTPVEDGLSTPVRDGLSTPVNQKGPSTVGAVKTANASNKRVLFKIIATCPSPHFKYSFCVSSGVKKV